MAYKNIGSIKVHHTLVEVVEKEIIPGTGIAPQSFWGSLEKILNEFAPENEGLLRKRDSIQAQIDNWYLQHSKNSKYDAAAYAAFLGEIGYIVPEGPDFKVETKNVDPEIACTPGPQLVVPVDNARYALNAANARWGSLLDAFYGTDAGPPETAGLEKGKSYNPKRGQKVFEYAHEFLDAHFGLAGGAKYGDVQEFRLNGSKKSLECVLKNNRVVNLAQPSQFVGFVVTPSGLGNILMKHHGLHVEIQIDAKSQVGSTHPAGVKDIMLESAITAIADCEDSVAAVDAADKSVVYRNWNGLMKGTLAEKFTKGGKEMVRKLNPDKRFTSVATGAPLVIPGRVVLLVRNVGIHMYTDAVKFVATDREVPEGLVDAMVTTLAALHDLKGTAKQEKNSRTGSMYMVKPKQHGPEEVAYTVRMLGRVEQELGLARNTIKVGIMDEERRTTVNLKECIRAAKERCIFINTGFLDRTGDEIHTCFRAGPVLPKADIKKAKWRTAYEDWNVDIGIETGLVGVAQIGKGMWAAPDNMKEMLEKKVSEPRAGATTAWVPSPTAATLHVFHYHQVDVLAVQRKLEAGGRRALLSDIITPPMLDRQLSADEIQHELEDNLQGLLGYIVRWIELGVGCSKVPDINDVGLMEDRATLRISSQHIGNWLHWGIISEKQLIDTAHKMARIVDKQNASQGGYDPMSPKFSNNGFQCALEMIFNALDCPNGLTEHTLTKYRRAEKGRLATSKM
uniref:Malate synthase n=1 Tax=Mucochytrium quahogii TaxID=96639 RepID=A0A7S2WGG4_9STRA|mmetsp:Transcript_7588/g.12262  ORF Transcript_7588/g.12262 Transcript_7588/m.12262 type:complete len:735 (-) Transcript_7588:1781-3985(-)